MQPSALTPEQERVKIFLRAADRDLETAESLVTHSPHLYESVGFSCQQAVEKYAKAVLVTNTLPAPFTHVLVKLLQPLVQLAVIRLEASKMAFAAVLQDFAVEWRYGTDDSPSYISADLLDMAQLFRSKLRPLVLAFLL